MTRILRGLFASLCLVASAASAKPLSVYIEAGELGQGFLLQRLGSCYAITPAHVLDGELFASVVGGLPDAPRGDADALMDFGYDLSILRVSGTVTRNCTETFRLANEAETVIFSASTGYLHTVQSDGSVARQEVTLVDSGMLYVHVKPVTGGEPLMKGMSGSLLLVSDEPAGMLMSVDANTGEGRVLRYDRLTETVAPFFSRGKAAPKQSKPSAVVGARDNLAREVVGWSASPISPEFRVGNLLDDDPATFWLARVEEFPVDIEILLSADKSVVLNGVELSTAGMGNREQTPRDYELMVSNAASGATWLPIRGGTLFSRDETSVVSFAPVRVRRILLRIHSNWGDGDGVGLAGIVAK